MYMRFLDVNSTFIDLKVINDLVAVDPGLRVVCAISLFVSHSFCAVFKRIVEVWLPLHRFLGRMLWIAWRRQSLVILSRFHHMHDLTDEVRLSDCVLRSSAQFLCPDHLGDQPSH
jgi:hypothetical protein